MNCICQTCCFEILHIWKHHITIFLPQKQTENICAQLQYRRLSIAILKWSSCCAFKMYQSLGTWQLQTTSTVLDTYVPCVHLGRMKYHQKAEKHKNHQDLKLRLICSLLLLESVFHAFQELWQGEALSLCCADFPSSAGCTLLFFS